MLTDVFPRLKSLLQPSYRAFYFAIPSRSNPRRPRATLSEIRNLKSRGFTIIELVIVLVLIGIIAVYAAPRLGDMTAMKAVAFADKLRADIRYAQNLAMTQGRRTRVQYGAGFYFVTQDTTGICGGFNPVNDPAGTGALLVLLNAGTYAGITINPSMVCLEFDSLGRPNVCSPGVCTTNVSGMTIGVIANGVTTVDTVAVSSQTGAVN